MDLTRLWLQEHISELDEDVPLKSLNLMAGHIAPWFGDRTDISQNDVRDFYAAKNAEGLPDNEVSTMIKLLHLVLSFGASKELCRKPEWTVRAAKPESKRKPVILSPEQQKKLTDYLIDNPSRKHLCIYLILTTGISISEVLSIRGSDVLLRRGRIIVHSCRGPVAGRENKTRPVPIGPAQRTYLKKFVTAPENYLCTDKPTPYQRDMLEISWRTLSKRLLLPPMLLTDLRHTFAVRALQSGMSPVLLSRTLGLSTPGYITKIYDETID